MDASKLTGTIDAGRLPNTYEPLLSETNQVSTAQIQNNAITEDKLDDDAVVTAAIKDDAVTTNKIDDNAVTNSKVASRSFFTNPGIAMNKLEPLTASKNVVTDGSGNLTTTTSVYQTELSATNQVSTTQIENGAITKDKLEDDAVVTAAIKDDAVTNAKIDSVAASKITGELDVARIPSLPASKITSGSFAVARIPNLSASKITSGTFGDNRIAAVSINKFVDTDGSTALPANRALVTDANGVVQCGTNNKITTEMIENTQITTLKIAANAVTTGKIAESAVTNSKIDSVAASKVTGELDVARIPSLPASRITSETFAVARIPNLNANKITSGSFNLDQIPGLPASKITSDVFALARIPNLSAGKITSGTFGNNRIAQSAVDNSKIASGVDALKIGDGLVSNEEFKSLNGITTGSFQVTNGTDVILDVDHSNEQIVLLPPLQKIEDSDPQSPLSNNDSRFDHNQKVTIHGRLIIQGRPSTTPFTFMHEALRITDNNNQPHMRLTYDNDARNSGSGNSTIDAFHWRPEGDNMNRWFVGTGGATWKEITHYAQDVKNYVTNGFHVLKESTLANMFVVNDTSAYGSAVFTNAGGITASDSSSNRLARVSSLFGGNWVGQDEISEDLAMHPLGQLLVPAAPTYSNISSKLLRVANLFGSPWISATEIIAGAVTRSKLGTDVVPCVAGGYFTGGAVVRKSRNLSVSRTTSNSTGRYTATFNTAMDSAYYVIHITVIEGNTRDDIIPLVKAGSITSTGFSYVITEQDNSTSAGTYRDRDHMITVFDFDV